MIKYLVDRHKGLTVREQLKLFAFNNVQAEIEEILKRVRGSLSKRERLSVLLESELNFHGQDSSTASHDIHAFAAKFPPQLPRTFIRGLTEPGDLVLDPMMGSGTTIVEAALEGRRAIGLDIDPLAIRLGSVKTTPMNIEELQRVGNIAVSRATLHLKNERKIERAIEKKFDEKTKAFIDYWFLPATQRELMALLLAIREVEESVQREFLELVFSAAIVTKSGGVSLARDLAHSRPHLDKTKVPKNAIDSFLRRFKKSLLSLSQLKVNGVAPKTITGDARQMPLQDNTVDLVVTSPPYANAIDYMRAHKFSLVWFGESVSRLSDLRAEYIGSEKLTGFGYAPMPKKCEKIIELLAAKDKSKAGILHKYLSEMRTVLREIQRVLKPNSPAILVVGTSTMREINVETHECIAELARELKFDVVGVAERILDRNKRMMPARFGKKSGSMIEERMHEEYVIGLLKPEPSHKPSNANTRTNNYRRYPNV